MYTEKELANYEFFKEYFSNHNVADVLDELTGLLDKNMFLKFMNYLIENNKTFSLTHLDLDNFKSINDTYGEKVGNTVILDVAKNLKAFVGESGVVSRLDGDRLGIISFDKITYDQLHDSFQSLMHNGKVLRKNVPCGMYSPFITATLGAAIFPTNAKTLEDLEDKVAKTLYRGKQKGRNCFIIWVEEKHKDIVINPLYKETFDKKVRKLFQMFESKTNYSVNGDDIPYVFNYVRDDMLIEYLLYVDQEYKVYDSSTTEVLGKIKNIDSIFDKYDQASFNFNSDVMNFSTELHYIFDDLNIQSSYMLKLVKDNKFYGYFIYGSKRTSRLWDPTEKTMLFLLAQLYSKYLDEHKIVGIKKFKIND